MTDAPVAPVAPAAVEPAIQKMDLGESKTAKVTIDMGESKEKPSVNWTSTGSVLVQQNPDDPTSVKVYGNIGGLGTVRASVDFAGKHIELVKDVIVIEKSVVPSNKIEFS